MQPTLAEAVETQAAGSDSIAIYDWLGETGSADAALQVAWRLHRVIETVSGTSTT